MPLIVSDATHSPPAVTLQPPFQQPNQFELAQQFAYRAWQDLFFQPGSIATTKTHLDAAVQWLKRSQDCSPDDGVSWGYSLKGGWRQLSYRETSGYIADTFFDLAIALNDPDAFQRAVRICQWLTTVQNANGSISDPRYGADGIVFDTGQVLQGFLRAYKETQDAVIWRSATAAAQWLVQVADDTGRWTRHTHNGIPHVYNARVAWILLQYHTLDPDPELARVARANLDWALSQQSNGWFDQCAFAVDVPPFTHTIAYAIRGILEAGFLLQDQTYTEAATTAAIAVMQKVHADGFLPGQIDIDGTPYGHYCCLTGNCQMAIIWLKLFETTGDRRFYEVAERCLRYVMATQDWQTANLNIRGGIKGSQPIWGIYTRLSYPNWATKFFIDALLLLLRLQS